MAAGRSGHGEFRSADAWFGMSVRQGLIRIAVVVMAMTLAACQQSVMVRPVRGAGDAPSAPARGERLVDAPTHTVQGGDTLYKISMQYGVDFRDLAAWNNISAPYTIYPQQRLRVGPERYEAASAPVAQQRTSREDNRYVKESGNGPKLTPLVEPESPVVVSPPIAVPSTRPPVDSSTPMATLSEEPDTAPLPATTATQLAADPLRVSPPPVSSPATAGTAAAIPPAPVGSAAPTIVAVRPTTAVADIERARPSAAGWIWPTDGKVVVTYSGGDPTRQGIDIAGTQGQSVRAARDGEVVYSGAGLIGYGELIIVKHSPELLSAYGHNRVRLVKEGQKLKAGEKIAEMGKNAANRVLLHFEIRKNGKPIDPLPLLPRP